MDLDLLPCVFKFNKPLFSTQYHKNAKHTFKYLYAFFLFSLILSVKIRIQFCFLDS